MADLWIVHEALDNGADRIDLLADLGLKDTATLDGAALIDLVVAWYGGNWPKAPDKGGRFKTLDLEALIVKETPRSVAKDEYLMRSLAMDDTLAMAFVSPVKVAAAVDVTSEIGIG